MALFYFHNMKRTLYIALIAVAAVACNSANSGVRLINTKKRRSRWKKQNARTLCSFCVLKAIITLIS